MSKLTIELDVFSNETVSYDEDGAPIPTATLEEAIVSAAANKILESRPGKPKHRYAAADRVRDLLTQKIEAAVDERVQSFTFEQVEVEVRRIIDEGWRKTDEYGTPIGEPLKLKDRVSQILNSKADSYARETKIEKMAKEAIEKALHEVFKDEIEKARIAFSAQVDAVLQASVRSYFWGAEPPMMKEAQVQDTAESAEKAIRAFLTSDKPESIRKLLCGCPCHSPSDQGMEPGEECAACGHVPIASDNPQRSGQPDATAKLREARSIIDRDRTGLAAGLNAVIGIARGYHWLGAGEWGSYDYTEQKEETLRREIAEALTGIIAKAGSALHESGKLANEACRSIDDFLRASGSSGFRQPCEHGNAYDNVHYPDCPDDP